MRIATSQYQSTMTQSLQLNQERMTYLSRQMVEGKRILAPSDDPVDSVRLARLEREENTVQQYRANIGALKLRLTKSEGYLSNMVDEIISGRDLLVWAADGGNAPDDLKAMIAPLTSLRDSLFFNANTKDQEGRSLFAGTLTNTAAISYDATAPLGARYTYTGNTSTQDVVIGNGISQASNENLGGLQQLLNRMDQSIAALSVPGASPNDPAVRAILAANLDGFDAALNLVSGKVATLGGIQNIVTTLDANHANISLSNKMAITDIGQLDYGVAATELNGYQSALQATYKAYGRISNLSLFATL